MAFWSVIGKGIGDVDGKTFGVSLDTSTNKWTAVSPSVDKFFITKSGAYKIVGLPENGTQLVNGGPTEVAFFTNLNGTSVVGRTGTGRTEKGVTFNWTLDSK